MDSTTTQLKIIPFLVKNEPPEDSFENEDDGTLSEKTLETFDQTNVLKRNLDMNGPNETVTVSTSVNNIEDMTITGWTITEKEFENIPDVPNDEKIVLISIRNKDRGSKIAESDQRKDPDNAEKKVSRKKKKLKEISRKKVKGSSMKTLPKKFKCNDCRASFVSRFNLRNHINAIHLQIKPYECEQCKKSFSQEGHMKIHVKEVHQKLRPYRCMHCDHFSSRKRDLAGHVKRVHLNIKPSKKIVCKQCGAPFESNQCLEHHMNSVHLNFRPYKCNLCEKAFFIKNALNKHFKKSHQEEAK